MLNRPALEGSVARQSNYREKPVVKFYTKANIIDLPESCLFVDFNFSACKARADGLRTILEAEI